MEFELSKIKLHKIEKEKGLLFPKEPSIELAEFIGILAGDGYVSFTTSEYKTMISGNFYTDYDYFHDHIYNLVRSLFGINLKIVRKKNTNGIIAYFHSRSFVSYLQELDFFKLLKQIKIPTWIQENNLYMIAFIRGLFDTDGSVFISDKKGSPNYPCIELTTICLNLASIVRCFLLSRGFRVPPIRTYYYKHSNNASLKVSLYGWKNLEKWINEIGFSNSYKMNRALSYRKENGGTGGI